METIRCDIAVVGAGPGGYVAALHAARAGRKVALVEREKVGGMCLHWGCIPSKSVLAAADLLRRVRDDAAAFGLTGCDFAAARPDWRAMVGRANANVEKLAGGVRTLLSKAGVTLVSGEATVPAPGRVVAGETEILCADLILATGSSYPKPAFAIDDAFLTPKSVYAMPDLPKSLLVVGAGVVGVEFALLFSLLGVPVTLVEKSDKFMPYLDGDLAQELRRALRRRKVKLLEGHEAVRLEGGTLTARTAKGEVSLSAERALLCPARTANTAGLEPLVKMGMRLSRGFVRTDARCRTALPRVYAVGDLAGRAMLAHVASAEGVAAADEILGRGRDLAYDLMPWNLYGHPEVASVGMTEEGARSAGFLAASGKFSLSANGKAIADGTAEGFVKVVFDKASGEILGVHAAAANATDLIGEGVSLMHLEARLEDVARMVHPHPTLVETMAEAVWKGLGRPIHTL